MYKILIFVILFFLKINFALAEIINDIKILGNKRVSDETIINFSEIKKGDDVTNNILNNSLKELIESNFFEDVSMKLENNILTINVIEFPIIQEIRITGIKKKQTIKDLKDQIFLKEKNPFNEILIKNDLNLLLNIFKQSGYYFTKIETKVEKNLNDTVNLIFDVNRGSRASINKIRFIGDKKFKDRKLHSVITSEEDKFWKIISNKKYLNLERVNLDKRLLKNFYREKGFYKVNITDAYSEIVGGENFILTFNIDAGKKFYFGNFDMIFPSDFDPEKFKDLQKLFKNLKGQKYSYKSIEKILDKIENIASIENYEFINASVVENIIENDINFSIEIEETEKVYVNKINILGNNITSEEFIRDNLIVDEGDPFNKILHNKSVNKLKSRGLFKTVKSEIKDSKKQGFKDIDIIIEEKPTGEISAGAGYGTDGSTFSFGVKENNFNGKGITLETNLAISEETLKGMIKYSHPNFAYSDRALSTSLESTVTDKLTNFGYKSSLNRASLGTRYEQYENTFFSPEISISDETLETTSSASAAYQKQEGSYFDTIFGYGLTFDKRNSYYQPSSGFYSNWVQQIPIISDDQTLLNGYSLSAYNEVADDMIISTGIYTRAVNSLSNDDVRVSKRLFVPTSRLRGFESGKVGPKDGNDYIGGNYIATINTSSTIPYILQTQENIDLKVFLDAGNVWGVDYSSTIDDSNTIRSSAGISLELLTPVGPLSFTLSEVLTKASTDRTESFRFQLGTTF